MARGQPRDGIIGSAHFNDSLARQPSAATQQSDLGVLQPFHLAVVFPGLGEERAPPQNSGGIERTCNGLFGAIHAPRRLQRGRTAEQHFAGDAGRIRAFAAHQVGFDDRGCESALHRAIGNVLARGSSADDDDVEKRLRHAPPFLLIVTPDFDNLERSFWGERISPREPS